MMPVQFQRVPDRPPGPSIHAESSHAASSTQDTDIHPWVLDLARLSSNSRSALEQFTANRHFRMMKAIEAIDEGKVCLHSIEGHQASYIEKDENFMVHTHRNQQSEQSKHYDILRLDWPDGESLHLTVPPPPAAVEDQASDGFMTGSHQTSNDINAMAQSRRQLTVALNSRTHPEAFVRPITQDEQARAEKELKHALAVVTAEQKARRMQKPGEKEKIYRAKLNNLNKEVQDPLTGETVLKRTLYNRKESARRQRPENKPSIFSSREKTLSKMTKDPVTDEEITRQVLYRRNAKRKKEADNAARAENP